MTPLLVIQIVLFPFIAGTMASYWENATVEVALQEAASQMGSTIEQLYLSLNRNEVSTGTITQTSTFPTEIASHPYTAKGSLLPSSEPNSGNILLLNLTLQDVGITIISRTPLGSNALWDEESVFYSSSPNPSIKIQKFENGTLLFSFE